LLSTDVLTSYTVSRDSDSDTVSLSRHQKDSGKIHLFN
jgi:hypothetical protein